MATACMTDGGEFRVLRLKLGLTCEELATELGVHEMTVYRWDRGRKVRPSMVHALLGLALRMGDENVTEELLGMLGGTGYWRPMEWLASTTLGRDGSRFVREWLRDRDGSTTLLIDGKVLTKRRLLLGGRAYVCAVLEDEPDRVVLGLWSRA